MWSYLRTSPVIFSRAFQRNFQKPLSASFWRTPERFWKTLLFLNNFSRIFFEGLLSLHTVLKLLLLEGLQRFPKNFLRNNSSRSWAGCFWSRSPQIFWKTTSDSFWRTLPGGIWVMARRRFLEPLRPTFEKHVQR